jgi:hypothetical protein
VKNIESIGPELRRVLDVLGRPDPRREFRVDRGRDGLDVVNRGRPLGLPL